ncbi:four helix bundle protein [Peteryoungia desertarenae]|uniref:Four helix bundle protein n=1 Tax=Peteryoungia desertarenae TaxID=1813451 RepID=A0ABX6QSX4_9HYPH|nr:four helix bundle protein [Peteryoungia desertarenae]QLF71386.1 four helix bundle protein [Peteryoungia desertarenae]
MDLAVESYELTKDFPREEVYGLVSQIRRAASSGPANIAEGHGRNATGLFVQHLKIAQGSLKELETHFILSSRLGFVPKDQIGDLMIMSEEVGKMLRSLIRSLQETRNGRPTE